MKINICFLVFLSGLMISNCISIKSSLLDQNLFYEKKVLKQNSILVRNVRVFDNDENLKNAYEMTMKSNIKILLENSKLFKNVEYYSKFSSKFNSVIIDIKFKKYENNLYLHPFYFQLSMITLTLYIWIGGTIVVHESDIDMQVDIYDNKYNLITSNEYNLKFKLNENIYNKSIPNREIPKLKSIFILNSITSSLNR
jgi:hypothetical protein